MAIELKLPELGEGIDSGDVLEILVSVGDEIAVDQGVVELETEKATVSVPASHAGKVTKILVKAGETVRIGQALVEVEPVGAKGTATPPPQESPAPQNAQTESRPTTPAPTASPPAVSASAAGAAGESNRAAAVATQSGAGSPVAASPSGGAAAPARLPAGGSRGHVPAGPAIRRFAREVGVDLLDVSGTGPNGRITREDVLRVVRNGVSQRQGSAPTNGASVGRTSAVETSPGGSPPAAAQDAFGPVRMEKMTRIRRTIAERMHLSWTTVPRVTNFDDADVTDLEEFRGQSKEDYAKQGVKLTSLPFVLKAVAISLKAHPLLNASIDMAGGQIIYKDYVHIGIAVDTERGLVVPVLRDADKLSIPQIARQLQTIAENARSGDFSLEDLRGGTFTISNLGAIGGSYSTPIVNTPETAILLVGRSRKMPVVVEDRIAVRLMMPLSISYDHRLIDGSTAARFLNDVIGYLQAPSRLLLTL